MTAREMQIAFMRELSNINSEFEYPNILDSDQVFYFINLAQDRYLKETYITKETVKDNIEAIKKKIDDLKQLITRATLFTDIINVSEPSLPLSSVALPSSEIKIASDGALMLPLPTNYIYYIRSASKIDGTYLNILTKGYVENLQIEYSEVNSSLLVSAYNNPVFRSPYITLETNPTGTTVSKAYMILYKDAYTNIYNLELTYIRKPKNIVLTVTDSSKQTTECELSTITHQEIVSYAVRMFIEEYKYKLTSNKSK